MKMLPISDRIAVGEALRVLSPQKNKKKWDPDPTFEGRLRGWVALILGFKSDYPYRLARSVVASGDQALIDQMDRRVLSIKGAYHRLQSREKLSD